MKTIRRLQRTTIALSIAAMYSSYKKNSDFVSMKREKPQIFQQIKVVFHFLHSKTDFFLLVLLISVGVTLILLHVCWVL